MGEWVEPLEKLMKEGFPYLALLALLPLFGHAQDEGLTVSSPDGLALDIQGVPAPGQGGDLLLRLVRLSDAVLSIGYVGSPASHITLAPPQDASLIVATYFGGRAASTLSASAGVRASGGQPAAAPVQINLQPAPAGSAPGRSPYPMTPPAKGRALGFNVDEFIATGSGVEGTGRGFMDYVVTVLSQWQCEENGDDSYFMVESANPRSMAALAAEIDLQQSPAFDPSTRITPHWIAWTHIVRGSYTGSPGGGTASLRVEDRAGNVVARATARTSGDEWGLYALDRAAMDLSDQLCRRRYGSDWAGTVTITEDASVSGGGISGKRAMNMDCHLDGRDATATCKIDFSSSVKSSEGSGSEKGQGVVPCSIQVTLTDDKLQLDVGMFRLNTITRGAIKGGSGSGPTLAELGGWHFEDSARPEEPYFAGSGSFGTVKATWVLRRPRE
jgi:hypothetical protein